MTESKRDNLENFFKKKAGNPEIDFQEADWKKLEAQLDKEMPMAYPFWSFLKKILPILFIAFIAFIGWNYLKTPEQSNDEVSLQKKAPASPTATEKKHPIEQKSKKESVQQESSSAEAETGGITQLLPNADIHSTSGFSDAASIEPQKSYDNYAENIGYVVSGNGDEAFRLREASPLHFLSAIPPKSSILPNDFIEIKSADVEVLKNKTINKSHFIVGIGYSPDFSTVGLDNFISPGSRLKLYLEYNIKNTLALSTGVEWVKNKYEAYGEEYHAPQRYWYNGITADEAHGECLMIDVPLNIRYQAFTRGRHQLFVSAGASTYFLLKEDYYFNYEQDDPNLPHYWGTEKMSIYPFGIINASIGYEYLLRSKSSIQLEPYIKIPTAGVGWGNVELYTIGAYISYRYRIR